MKDIFINITSLLLISIVIGLQSCHNERDPLYNNPTDFSLSNRDSLTDETLIIIDNYAKKHPQNRDVIKKKSQILYKKGLNEYSSERLLSSADFFYKSLNEIQDYVSKTDIIKMEDYLFRGEIYEKLGDIYKDINDLKPATKLYDKALSDFENAENLRKTLNILIKTGKLYQFNHIPNIALIYYEIAEEKKNLPEDIFRIIVDNKIISFYELGDYKSADSIFQNHFDDETKDLDYHLAIGIKYYYERNYIETLPHLLFCFENGNQQEKIATSEMLSDVYFNLKDQKNEMLYTQYQAKINSSEIRKTPLKLDLEKLYDNYSSTEITTQQEKSGTLYKYHKYALFTALIVILTVIAIIIFNKIKYHKKISAAEKTISDTHKTIQNKDKIIDDISKKLENLKTDNHIFEDSYQSFCNSDIYIKTKSSLEDVVIFIKTVQDYPNLALSNKDLIQLTKTFNDCFPEITSSLKKDFPSLTGSDIRFIILNVMNFSEVEIAVLLNLTYGAVNKRNNKLKGIFDTKDALSNYLLQYIASKF